MSILHTSNRPPRYEIREKPAAYSAIWFSAAGIAVIVLGAFWTLASMLAAIETTQKMQGELMARLTSVQEGQNAINRDTAKSISELANALQKQQNTLEGRVQVLESSTTRNRSSIQRTAKQQFELAFRQQLFDTRQQQSDRAISNAAKIQSQRLNQLELRQGVAESQAANAERTLMNRADQDRKVAASAAQLQQERQERLEARQAAEAARFAAKPTKR